MARTEAGRRSTVTLAVRVDPELADRVDRMAREHDLSRPQILRRALRVLFLQQGERQDAVGAGAGE